MLCTGAAYAIKQSPSIRLSVTFVYSVDIYLQNFLHRRVSTPF